MAFQDSFEQPTTVHLIVIKQGGGGGGERRMISPLVGAEEQLRVLFDVPLGIGDSVSHTVRTHQISREYKKSNTPGLK